MRTGVDAFLDAALQDGARVAVVAATASVPEDGLVSSAMLNLGPNRWARVCLWVEAHERGARAGRAGGVGWAGL